MKIGKDATDGPSAALLGEVVVMHRQAPSKAPVHRLRIVLVEDSEPDIELVHQALLDSGLNISLVTVDTRDEYEAELRRQKPNIILSDYWLPTFDGGMALDIAKEIAPEVPFILVTGILGEEVVIEMLKQGATDYVLKTRLARLVPAVTRALRETEQRRDRQEAEEKLIRSHGQLRALTGHLQFVREEERTRIAREVHDELGQALTGLKLDLSMLSGKPVSDRVLKRRVRAMEAQVDATILTVRRIATELRPGVLDNLGLAAAIEWQAMDFQKSTGVRCQVSIHVTESIWDREFSTVCFRIFQETLTNIIRHANATQVEVVLTQADNELILIVSDNGRGISDKDVADARSIGITGMRERVAQVGGEVSFLGVPNKGTTVTMRVPIPEAVARDEGAV
jgi:signal transduction histidine kinase